MAEDWDLYAIVRSCTSATVTANTNTSGTSHVENALDCSGSLTFDGEDLDDPFSFLKPRDNGWQELQDSYKPFLPTTSGQGNIPFSSICDFGEFRGLNQPQLARQHHHHQQQQPPPPPPTSIPFSLRFNGIQQELQHAQQPQRQQLHQQNSSRVVPCPVLSLRSAQSLASRSRKKKSHVKRQVIQVTAENLNNDVWAWRKYGQKPIKGSPHPRNYYRCSSSKGCAARKQVERSNTDPNMFIVSFTGDHTHPRPTHRNSLAGSTRNKFTSLQKATATESKESGEPEKAPCSPPLSATSLSPTTSVSAASMDHEAAAPASENSIKTEAGNYTDGADVEGHIMKSDDDYDDDDDDILIPNMILNEDLIKGLQGLGGVGEDAFGVDSGKSAGLGHSPADFGNNFSSWIADSSAAAAGGGG